MESQHSQLSKYRKMVTAVAIFDVICAIMHAIAVFYFLIGMHKEAEFLGKFGPIDTSTWIILWIFSIVCIIVVSMHIGFSTKLLIDITKSVCPEVTLMQLESWLLFSIFFVAVKIIFLSGTYPEFDLRGWGIVAADFVFQACAVAVVVIYAKALRKTIRFLLPTFLFTPSEISEMNIAMISPSVEEQIY